MQNRGYSADWLYQLKQKNNIVSIIGRYVHLEKKGSRYWACCPFHNEKTASFTVSEDDGFYYCFGCKESGDVITFVMKYESCDFADAVKILAKNAGMEVPEFTGDKEIIERKKEKERVLKLLDLTYKHYQQNLLLPEAKPAQEYIKTRQFTKNEIDDFKIGYSLNWTELIDYLLSQGFTHKEMLSAGVAQCKNDKYYDVMAERLVFPIFDSMNECIGFSARVLGQSDFAKYKNTAETIVFQKGRVVFAINLVKALKQQGKLDKIIIVEGQIDVIAMHRAGFKSTVACMGTALTKENAHELKKLSNKIVLCFDGDDAGTKATLRSIDILRDEGFDVTIVSLPDKHDPDEILKEYGREYLEKLIESALPITDYLINYELKNYDINKPDEKGKFATSVLKHIAKLGSNSEEEPYLDKLRSLIGIPNDVLRRDLDKIKGEKIEEKSDKNITDSVLISRQNGNIKAIRFILSSLIYKKDYVDKKIDYCKLLPGYKDIIEKANEGLPISSYFDYFDVEGIPILKDCLNFDFLEVKDVDKRYFDECVWAVAKQEFERKLTELNEKYKQCETVDERVNVATQISELNKVIQKKNVEEFYVR